MAFEVGEKCVVPALGVGKVRAIKELELEGTSYPVYEIELLQDGLVYTCPIAQAGANGLRGVMPEESVKRVYEVLEDRETPPDKQTWNRRYREYTQKIHTGDPLEVAGVLRDLCMLKRSKPLSFGERKMYDQASGLMIQELAEARGVPPEKIQEELDELFKP